MAAIDQDFPAMAKPKDKLTIDLYGLETFFLIVEHPTGVLYRNQTGGVCCMHPTIEGFGIPLEVSFNKSKGVFRLEEHWFDGNKKSHFYSQTRITDYVKDVKGFLAEAFPDLHFDLKRSRTMQHGEAWIPVIIKTANHYPNSAAYETLVGKQAILTYKNSD